MQPAIAAKRGPLHSLANAVENRPLGARFPAVLLVALFSLTPELKINVALIALASGGLVLLALVRARRNGHRTRRRRRGSVLQDRRGPNSRIRPSAVEALCSARS
jgi:hypothetical protein